MGIREIQSSTDEGLLDNLGSIRLGEAGPVGSLDEKRQSSLGGDKGAPVVFTIEDNAAGEWGIA